MVEDDIKESAADYPKELKTALDRSVDYYQKGGKMVSPAEMNRKLSVFRKLRK